MLSLPGFAQLCSLDRVAKEVLGAVVLALRDDAAARADASWMASKAPMAAYWRAVATHAGVTRRALDLAPAVARPRIAIRRTPAERRNPVLALDACARMAHLSAVARATIASALASIQADARRAAQALWLPSPDAAAYWRAVAVYAGHLRRALHTAIRTDQYELAAA